MLTYPNRQLATDSTEITFPNPNLCLSIRDLILGEISSDVEVEAPAIRELAARLRDELSLLEMNKREPFSDVAGADAGSQTLPLASKRYAVISALVYSLPSGSRFFMPPEAIVSPYTLSGENFEGTVSLRREAKLFETVYGFIGRHPDTELILIDGPLAFSGLWRITGRRSDQVRLIDAINRLLRTCMEQDIIVAGVVKRASARYMIYHLGLQDETDLPDAFLLLQALRTGERTEVFSPRAALRQADKGAPFMDAIRVPIHSFYGRFSRDWSIPPMRIDLPAFSLGKLDEIADYCYGSSLWNGVPLPLVRADEEVRISRRFVSEIYVETLSCVGRRSGEVSHLAPCWGEGVWMGENP